MRQWPVKRSNGKVEPLWMDGRIDVGTKIKFSRFKTMYTVRASNIVFLICTRPLNMIRKTGRWGLKKNGKAYEHEKTVLYTCVNLMENIRGTENLIFGMGAESDEDCEDMLKRLTDGDSEVSHRNRVDLDIEWLVLPPRKRLKKKKRI